jgi:tetratricopeptide (TPR) repeat protein
MQFFVIFALGLIMPHMVLASYSEAFSYFYAGEWKQASKEVEQVLKNKPSDIQALELKGRILLAEKKNPDAIKVFLQVLEIDPKSYSTQYYLGDAAFAEREWGDAMNAYLSASQGLKDPRDALLKYIYCKVATKDFTTAEKLATNFDPIDRDHPGYYFARAAIARALKKQTDVLANLQRAQTLYGIRTYNTFMNDYLWIQTTSAP